MITEQEWAIIQLSLQVAGLSVLISLPAGLFVAYCLARWEFTGKSFIDAFVHLPLVLPPRCSGLRFASRLWSTRGAGSLVRGSLGMGGGFSLDGSSHCECCDEFSSDGASDASID